MNLKVLQWLIRHREVLMQVVDVVKSYKGDLSLIEKWMLVDRVARLVIPVIDSEETLQQLLAFDLEDDDPVAALGMGVEVQALGIDYRLLLEVILPMVISILETFVRGSR